MNTVARKAYREQVMAIAGGRVVGYLPGLAMKAGGVKAGLLLSQLLYWSGDPAVQRRGGWLYKTVDELYQETGLSKDEQHTARNELIKRGLIEAKLKGIPRVWYYRVDLPRLAELFGRSVDALNVPAEPASTVDPAAPADQPETHPTAFPPEAVTADVGPDSRSILGGSSAQLNKELKITTEITAESECARIAVSVENEASSGIDAAGAAPAPFPAGNSFEEKKKKTAPEHPALALVREVTGRRPPKVLNEWVIDSLGESPDRELLTRVHQTWCLRGFNPANLEGQLEWYKGGIPPAGPAAKGQAGVSPAMQQSTGAPKPTYAEIEAAQAKWREERRQAGAPAGEGQRERFIAKVKLPEESEMEKEMRRAFIAKVTAGLPLPKTNPGDALG